MPPRVADNVDRDYNIRILSKRLHRISKNVTQEGRLQFEYQFGADIADFAKSLHHRLEQAWPETMKTLQSETFLDFCENYPRPKKTFVRADGPEDIVSSRVIL